MSEEAKKKVRVKGLDRIRPLKTGRETAPRPSLSTIDRREMQLVVLGVVLREYPVPLTYPAIACELFESPDDLIGGMTLARAVRDLVVAGLLHSNGPLVLPSRAALYVKRLSGRDGWSACC